MITDPVILLFVLIGGHFFLDFAGQGEFMSKAKNPNTPAPGIPWEDVLLGHAWIHGAFVAWLTGWWILGIAELVIHFFTDLSKCCQRLTFSQDQRIHVACKVLWWLCAISLPISWKSFL